MLLQWKGGLHYKPEGKLGVMDAVLVVSIIGAGGFAKSDNVTIEAGIRCRPEYVCVFEAN